MVAADVVTRAAGTSHNTHLDLILSAKKLVFVHYNKRLIRTIKRVDCESEEFKWEDVEGSDGDDEQD